MRPPITDERASAISRRPALQMQSWSIWAELRANRFIVPTYSAIQSLCFGDKRSNAVKFGGFALRGHTQKSTDECTILKSDLDQTLSKAEHGKRLMASRTRRHTYVYRIKHCTPTGVDTWKEEIVTHKGNTGCQFQFKNKRSIVSRKDYHFTHVLWAGPGRKC